MRDDLKAKLRPEERNLRLYEEGYLPVVGKFEASIQCMEGKLRKLAL